MISKDLGKITQRASPLQSYWLSVIQSKQTKEKQDTAAQACDSKRGILSSDLSDGALTTFLAKCQSVLSTNWACVSEGEIKRLQLPTETSSPGPAVKHKSKAAAPRLFGTVETQPTTSNNKAPVPVVLCSLVKYFAPFSSFYRGSSTSPTLYASLKYTRRCTVAPFTVMRLNSSCEEKQRFNLAPYA